MTNETYRIEWNYLSELSDDAATPYPYGHEAHCGFLIRFLDMAPGDGHCVFLSVNVITTAKAAELGIGPEGRRAYVVADRMTQEDFRRRVTDDVTRAFGELPHGARESPSMKHWRRMTTPAQKTSPPLGPRMWMWTGTTRHES